MPAQPQEAIHAHLLRGRAERPELKLFALLDGARDKRIVPLLREHDYVKTACLYSGNISDKLKSAAPWLAALEEGDGALLEELTSAGWGQAWGVFLLTSASLGQLRKHFRRFLQVYREDGSKLYFRFHDPRVVRAYLPTCSREELDFVIGPVSELLCEGADPELLLRYTLDEEEGLAKEVVRLAGDAPEEATAPAASGARSELLVALGLDPAGKLEEVRAIREALASRPGQPELLGLLARIGGRHFPEAAQETEPQLALLRSLAAEGAGPTALETGVESLPSNGSTRGTLVTLAPACNGQLTEPERTALSRSAQVLVDLDAFAERAQDLRTQLRAVARLEDAEEEQRTIQAAFRFLGAAQETSAAWEAPADDPLTSKAQRWIQRVAGRLEQQQAPTGSQVSAALMSLLVGFETRARGEAAKAAAKTAAGLLAALAGTLPAGVPGAAPAAPPPPPAPAPPVREPRRYTAKRRALPFERPHLIIRDEQVDALGEAVRAGLAARLLASARGRHPDRLEALGRERVCEVIDLALERSLDYGIQKFPALETLLDLMLTIDPEFTELEEYEWAKELLESDMIEPDSKPGLVAEQVAAEGGPHG